MVDIPRPGAPDAEAPCAADMIVRRLVGLLSPEPTELADPAAYLMRDLGFSSLRLMELAFAVEDLFAMESAAIDDAPHAGSVADLCDYITEKVSCGEATLPTAAAVDAAVAGY